MRAGRHDQAAQRHRPSDSEGRRRSDRESVPPPARPSAPAGLAPGLGLVTIGALVASIVAAMVGPLSVLVAAIIVGAVIGNAGLASERTQPGLTFAARRLLRVGVVLLGLRLSIADVGALGLTTMLVVATTVAVTFFGTQWLGRRLGLSNDLSLLVATGYSICGASAIVAVEGATDAEDEEVATAIGLVALFGTLAVFALPPLSALLGLTDTEFGMWAGASVHDVAQVVATAGTAGPTALATAIVVKLTRVVLLAPLVAGVSIQRRRTQDHSDRSGAPIVPLFVAGFLTMIALRSTGVLSQPILDIAARAEKVVFTMSLIGLGSGVRIQRLRALGPRPLVLGLAAWVLIASVAYVCIKVAV